MFFWYLGKGKSCFIILKSAFMSSYNVKIQFDSVENLLKCETMYLKKIVGTAFLVKNSLEKDSFAMSYYRGFSLIYWWKVIY